MIVCAEERRGDVYNYQRRRDIAPLARRIIPSLLRRELSAVRDEGREG